MTDRWTVTGTYLLSLALTSSRQRTEMNDLEKQRLAGTVQNKGAALCTYLKCIVTSSVKFSFCSYSTVYLATISEMYRSRTVEIE
jgi:hypothetical protein